MAIDEKLEQAVAESRGRSRQNKLVPWLIRDDGMIVPNVPLVAKKPNFRPYHGRIDASLEDRKRYLQNLGSKRRVIVDETPAEEAPPFVVSKANRDELVAFAQEQFGATLNPEDHLNKLRAQVAKLAGVQAQAQNEDSAQAAA
jgi:hypothetical protein